MSSIEFPTTPLTDDVFEEQGWDMNVQNEEGEEFYYWSLPLPKDNPDEQAVKLISTANDDWEEVGIKKGEYLVELEGMFGLGFCSTLEELEILYRALTKFEIDSK